MKKEEEITLENIKILVDEINGLTLSTVFCYPYYETAILSDDKHKVIVIDRYTEKEKAIEEHKKLVLQLPNLVQIVRPEDKEDDFPEEIYQLKKTIDNYKITRQITHKGLIFKYSEK